MAVADTIAVGGPNAGPAPVGLELKPSVPIKAVYAVGQAIESGYLVVAGFVFFYYTAVLGLSGSAVGLALGISMCLDAVMDPMIGSISDNVRSRLGRRLPLMVIGAPLTALALWMLFAPPLSLVQQPVLLFAWLVAAKMALRGVASVYNLPYAALGAEMASGYAERASVAAYRGFFGVLISFIIVYVAYSVFFADGLQVRDNYPAFGQAMGLLLGGLGLVCLLGVWRYARRLPQPTTPSAPFVSGLVRELGEVFRNGSFRALFISALAFWVAAGINGALGNHAYIFVWKLRPDQIRNISMMFYFAIMAGVPVARALVARMEKKTAVMLGVAIFLLAMTVVHLLRAAGIIAPTGDLAMWILIANVAVAGFGLSFLVVAYPAMMADAADEHEVLFGHRREGIYFAGLGFASKAAAGLGQMVAGFALTALNFPKTAGAAPGLVVPEGTLRLLILAWGPLAAVFASGAGLAMLAYHLTRDRHAEIAVQLAAKRARDVSEGRSSG